MPAKAGIQYAGTAVMFLDGAAYWIIRFRG
jgi:hypothetical protein